ncbi:apoptosis-inducing factor 2 [Podospora fimiseda]|uniref:Apoptosis-inducing factor 2 n=1 Tax=Podospora fimiseda TaxID=252190 RepID=A0AAN7BTI9_9PEZI|nr:apoptosis-inducing factor 2 [Podospora fimiseda]
MGSIPTTPLRVLIVGGSYAGLSAALNLQDLCTGKPPRCGPKPVEGQETPIPSQQFDIDITIIDERDGFFHLIGTPLALADHSYAAKTWINYTDLPAVRDSSNINILQGTVKHVDQVLKTAKYVTSTTKETKTVEYDYLIAAAGLKRVWPVVPQALTKKGWLLEAGKHTDEGTKGRYGVLVVGGGAVGIEMAAELKLVRPELNVTLVHSREKLLSSEPLPDDVKEKTLELLREGGVEVLTGLRVKKTEEVKDEQQKTFYRVTFEDGKTMLADQVSFAISRPVPATEFLGEEVKDDEGYVKIQPSLAFPEGSPNNFDHFAAGDLVKWSGIKRCGGAMHMGYFAANNVYQRIIGSRTGKTPEFLQLDEIPPMIGLAVGKNAVSYWPQSGMSYGEDVMKLFFGDDLGFTICWDHLGLGNGKGPV